MAKKHLLNITEIEDKTKLIIENLNKENFIEEFISLFDIPKTSITRAKKENEDFFIRNKIIFRSVSEKPLEAIDEISQTISKQKQKPRYIVTTDFVDFFAKDTKTNASLAILFEDLPAYADFFLAWNGIEKVDYQKENPADIKAAERFTKLYDELVKLNSDLAKEEVEGKSFNLFLIRSLFLYFAEDTEIIVKGSFTNIIKTRTKTDGSNLNQVIKELFEILDIPENKRENTPEWLKPFPYVNGKLFKEPHHDLKFSTDTRKLLIEAGELLNWNEINPDILGAMIQTVANKEARKVSGMHYTSVSNIMKVIKPLFLDDLQAEYQRLSDRAADYLLRDITEEQRRKQQRDIITQFDDLIARMSKIKFLDPACGSGNFLIITYKELRKLEIQCLVEIRHLREILGEKDVYQGNLFKQSQIRLNQFSGIELDDFAHEVARLSLYIAEHQMNIEMTATLADYQPRTLPLQEAGNIVHGNALRVDWNEVVPHEADDEVYIMGNPPYIGTAKQTVNQKKDIDSLFSEVPNHRLLDYISGWFIKGARYIHQEDLKLIHKNIAKFAFVTTNSINQGQQVAVLWNEIYKYNVEINFAYTSFKWANSASNNAGVTVSIIGLGVPGNSDIKYLFDENDVIKEVRDINAYLVEGADILVRSESNSISNLNDLLIGSAANDDGNLLLDKEKRDEITSKNPELTSIIKKFIGGQDFLHDNYRFIFWMNENSFNQVKENPIIQERVSRVRNYRKKSKREATQKLAEVPYRVGEIRHQEKNFIIIPKTSSESRIYVPMGYITDNSIIGDSAFAIYDAPIWLLGILTSRMHMTWLRAVGGRLKTDYRYSAGMVYNTFPIPPLSTQRKNMLEEAVLEMLDVREEEGGTLAELYGGANKPMNIRLREAHEVIDGIVERAYRQEPFKSDEERLSVLLKLYQEMTKGEE
ncbi:class I SAM-dependent DNA methyltransferase [Lactococcus lactis]|uniref:site-specific DNA-methyltransferase (adenine-specific) n=1 Tax=Lactococcus lactis subsp. lactis NCDO 2118 TaxID=1117941 RepID=A0ABC8A4I4_LACLL|nr:DNA methyltransferase [Lactococcus lactis]ABX75590.1 DNA methylase, putative [Lactococcus lactis subsp. lactis KF147]AII12102.1 DNA methylase [Lactococcus lactis subsp. lactis NCDO 2118]